MRYIEEVKAVLDQTLQLQGKSAQFHEGTALFGAVPEFDSMAVVTVVTTIEERFGIVIEDDEITADVFETVGSLARFVERKIQA